jgi:imidazolonepropionase-like amidohydrolase
MKKYTILSAFFLSSLLSANPQSKAVANRYWITDVFIVSPENLDHIVNGSVLIEDERIVGVERNQKVKPSAGTAIVRGNGQYLIPGLIDSHVHLSSIPGMLSEQEKANPEIVRAYLKQMPRSYLYYGYTTLVDLAVSEPQVLQDFRKTPLHPDLYDCGGSLPFANGYPMSFLPPRVRFKPFPNFIYDPKQADKVPPEYKAEDHTPEAAVARVKGSGGICVKTYFERGFADDRNLPVMGPEVLVQIRKAATENGLVLMIHANGLEAQKFAEEANVDVIVHGMWHWGTLGKSPQVPDEIKQVLDRIVEKKIGYQPTMQVLYGEMAYFDPEYLKLDAISKVAPGSMVQWFRRPEGKWFGRLVNAAGVPDAAFIADYEEGPMRCVRQVTAYLASKNANFVFGTDTPSGPTYGNLPGLNGYLEMKQLQKAGMSLAQIFRAATINNAREFRMDGQLGSIEPGKVANLVLMKRSPLQSIDAYDSITTIWVHGREVEPESLAATDKR